MLQDKKLWVDSLGVCYQRLLSTAYVAVPEAAQAKGKTPTHEQHLNRFLCHFVKTFLTVHLPLFDLLVPHQAPPRPCTAAPSLVSLVTCASARTLGLQFCEQSSRNWGAPQACKRYLTFLYLCCVLSGTPPSWSHQVLQRMPQVTSCRPCVLRRVCPAAGHTGGAGAAEGSAGTGCSARRHRGGHAVSRPSRTAQALARQILRAARPGRRQC